jgi:hypothetical protein
MSSEKARKAEEKALRNADKRARDAEKAAVQAQKARMAAFKQQLVNEGYGPYMERVPKFNPNSPERIIELLKKRQNVAETKKRRSSEKKGKTASLERILREQGISPTNSMRKKKLKREDYEKFAGDLVLRRQLLAAAAARGPNFAKSMALALPQRGRLKVDKNYAAAAAKKLNNVTKKAAAQQAKNALLQELSENQRKYVKARGHAAYINADKRAKLIELARKRHQASLNKKAKRNGMGTLKQRLMASLERIFPTKLQNKNITNRNLKSKKAYNIVKAAIAKRITKRIGTSTKDEKMNHIASLIGMRKDCIRIKKECLDAYEFKQDQ